MRNDFAEHDCCLGGDYLHSILCGSNPYKCPERYWGWKYRKNKNQFFRLNSASDVSPKSEQQIIAFLKQVGRIDGVVTSAAWDRGGERVSTRREIKHSAVV